MWKIETNGGSGLRWPTTQKSREKGEEEEEELMCVSWDWRTQVCILRSPEEQKDVSGGTAVARKNVFKTFLISDGITSDNRRGSNYIIRRLLETTFICFVPRFAGWNAKHACYITAAIQTVSY